jgi:hypothetical protein
MGQRNPGAVVTREQDKCSATTFRSRELNQRYTGASQEKDARTCRASILLKNSRHVLANISLPVFKWGGKRMQFNEIDNDVAKLYGRRFVVDRDDGHYSRANIRMWLLNWHEVSQLRSESLAWSRTVTDIEMAINSLPPRLIDMFEYYCVLGYTENEVNYIFQWKHKRSFANAWCELISRLCSKLLDRQVRLVSPIPHTTGNFAVRVEDVPRVCICGRK